MRSLTKLLALTAALAALAPATAIADTPGLIQGYPIPGNDGFSSSPQGIAAGPDGRIWFTEANRNVISRISTDGQFERLGALTAYPTGGGVCGTGDCNFSTAYARSLVYGPLGRFWFSEGKRSSYGSITLAGAVEEAAADLLPGAYGMALGPDGNLWIGESDANSIARVTPAGAIDHFTSGLTAGANPYGVTAGSDGALWFGESGRNALARATTSGAISEFSTGITSPPWDIATGPDGNIWFSEPDGNAIGRLNLSSGVVTEFHSGLSASGQPQQLAIGPDGNLWVSVYPVGVARVTPSGGITEYPYAPSVNSRASGVAAGPDGNMWFSDSYNTIAKIGTGAPAAVQAAPAVTGSRAAGEAQSCPGAQFATWAGVQPSPTGVAWTFNGAAAGTGQTFTPPSSGQLSCSVSAYYAAQQVPATATSQTVAIAKARKRQTTCSVKLRGGKFTLKCKTKLVAATTKLKKPKGAKTITLKIKRFKVKAVLTKKQLQLILPAGIPKGTYKVKLKGKPAKLKITQPTG